MLATNLTATAMCLHCGQATLFGSRFCCAGCESVYSLLQERGLGHFYTLQNKLSFSPPRAVAKSTDKAALNIADDLKGISQARFYIEGIHCLGCLWLLEKLPQIDEMILQSSLDLRNQILEVKIKSTGNWQAVYKLIEKLGYSAKVLDPADTNAKHVRAKDQRRQLLRLAIAAFSAGNIMLLSVGMYAGANSEWRVLFSWLCFSLALPTLTYSAWPLYQAALAPLRSKRISVDLPIVLALFAGMALSFHSLIWGDGSQIYFDAITMLVFLLLSSRYFFARTRERLIAEGPCLSFLSSERYHKKDKEVKAEELHINDSFALYQKQILPVDSILESSCAYFDLSLLTGESVPVKFFQRDIIEAGSRILDTKAELKVIRPILQSRLHLILEQVQQHDLHRSESVAFADRIGQYFAYTVLILALAVFFLSPNFAIGVQRALALVIVTCPCVLAFAVPLALVKCLQRAAKQGIIFRDAGKIESLADIKHAFIDKTGTLTSGEFEVRNWETIRGSEEEIKRAVRSLEENSQHPVAKSLVRYLQNVQSEPVKNFVETPGLGVHGELFGKKWEISALADKQAGEGNRVAVFCNGYYAAHATLGDSLRSDSSTAVEELQKEGIAITLLSGDHRDNVATIAKKLHIEDWCFGLAPEEKATIVKSKLHSLMVGDGANDAIAFKAANVGVAVQGAMDISLKNADIVLTKPGLTRVATAIKLSKQAMKLVRRNFAFTLVYNFIAGSLAITGLMQPLVAAILMPMSALTVFLYTEWYSRRRFL